MSGPFHRRALFVTAAGGLAIAGAWVALGAFRAVPLEPPRPSPTYEDAIARVDAIRSREGPDVNPLCRTRVLGAGRRTERVVVLLHGFTNCPKQFDSLAADLSRRGVNVLVPRIPRHGMADRMSPALRLLTAEELTRAGEEAVDIAHGLGERVTVVGLSSSAVLAGWLAQHRPDVDGAVLLAPSFAPRGMPGAIARRLTGALLRSPNFFVWWDRRLRAGLPGPRQCYPRFASRGLAEVYRLGYSLLDDAARGAPAAKRLAVVTTTGDEGVNNDLTADLARRWRARGARVETFEFPDSLGIHHDMIDPEQPYQRVAVTYPTIEALALGSDGR